jgi:hypothetical protein
MLHIRTQLQTSEDLISVPNISQPEACIGLQTQWAMPVETLITLCIIKVPTAPVSKYLTIYLWNLKPWTCPNLYLVLGWLTKIYYLEEEPSLKLRWVLTIANATGTNGLTCLPKHGGARDNKFWSPILRLAIENGA